MMTRNNRHSTGKEGNYNSVVIVDEKNQRSVEEIKLSKEKEGKIHEKNEDVSLSKRRQKQRKKSRKRRIQIDLLKQEAKLAKIDSTVASSFKIAIKVDPVQLKKGVIYQVERSKGRKYHNLQLCQKVIVQSIITRSNTHGHSPPYTSWHEHHPSLYSFPRFPPYVTYDYPQTPNYSSNLPFRRKRIIESFDDEQPYYNRHQQAQRRSRISNNHERLFDLEDGRYYKIERQLNGKSIMHPFSQDEEASENGWVDMDQYYQKNENRQTNKKMKNVDEKANKRDNQRQSHNKEGNANTQKDTFQGSKSGRLTRGSVLKAKK